MSDKFRIFAYMNQNVDNSRSVYRFGADNGVWMGLYLTLMSSCLLLSIKIQTLILLLIPLALGVPVVLYFLMKRIYDTSPHYRKVSALWLSGIWTFIFGALICGFVTATWLLLFDPTFIHEYFRNSIETIKATPIQAGYTAEIRQLEHVLETGRVPSPMEFAFSMMWSTAFFGSLLSLIVSLLMMRRRSVTTNV